MNYQERIVSVIRLVDLKLYVERSIDGQGYDRPDKIETLALGLNLIRSLDDEIMCDRQITQGPDTIVMSCLADDDESIIYLLRYMLWLHINLVDYGLLCQGGIAKGKLIHTEQLLFGPALLDADRLARESAIHPRIVLSPEMVQQPERSRISKFVKRDTDGLYYVDYISGAEPELNFGDVGQPEYLRQLSQLISTNQLWLKDKYREHVKVMKSKAGAWTEDDELRHTYEALPDFE